MRHKMVQIGTASLDFFGTSLAKLLSTQGWSAQKRRQDSHSTTGASYAMPAHIEAGIVPTSRRGVDRDQVAPNGKSGLPPSRLLKETHFRQSFILRVDRPFKDSLTF